MGAKTSGARPAPHPNYYSQGEYRGVSFRILGPPLHMVATAAALRGWPTGCGSGGRPEQLDEACEVIGCGVRHGAIADAALAPGEDKVTARGLIGTCREGPILRQLRHRDQMLAARINERGGGLEPDDVDPSAEKRIAFSAKVGHDGSKAKLAVEPRLHRVVVGGGNVHRRRRHQPANMRRHHFASELIAGLLIECTEGQSSGEDRAGEEGCRKAPPRAAFARTRVADPEPGLDPVTEVARGHIFAHVGPKRRAEQTTGFDLGGKRRFRRKPLLEAVGLERRKLAVEIGVEENLVLPGKGHDPPPLMAARRSRRARASRDMTVPMGMADTSAIVR